MTASPRIVWSKARVAAVREELRATSPVIQTPTVLSPFHEAAAVLAWFELNPTLQPTGRDVTAEVAAIEQLIADSILWEQTQTRKRWTLKNDVRKQALAQLGTLERIRAALATNTDRPDDTLQRVFEMYLGPSPKSLQNQSPDELTATLQVLDWLPATLTPGLGLPDETEVRRRIDQAALRAPFSMLATETFRGRKEELATLRDYVGVLPPSGKRAWVVRGYRNIRNLHEKPPLVIFGPGGMGKSTLLARFIQEHTAEGERQLPFVYLDFDRPGLVPDEPLTLLLEAVRQLGIQFPTLARAARDWVAQASAALAATADVPTSDASPSTASRSRSEFMRSCSVFIDDLQLGDTPLVLVLDTFEEVQYRGEAYVAELWRFLEEFQSLVPRLRTVIAGRARVFGQSTEELPLDSLNTEAAESFLQANGITDKAVAQALARQLRRNPLSLKLAAQVLRYEPATTEGIKDLNTGGLLRRVDDNRIQGELYRRILSHIQREDVRKLAHPGLILRRITPELIADVLAVPCGVTITSSDQAKELFDALRKEVSLVTSTAGNSREVRHRSDVRRVMLDLLRKSDHDRVEQIENLAVDYYVKHGGDDPELRAEEIYHRLGLGQDPSVIGERWLPGVDDHLRNAVEDFTGNAQSFLASRLGIEPAALRLDEEPDAIWEPIAQKQAQDLLALNRPEQALILLRSRSVRTPRSPLYLLEGQALRELGRPRELRLLTQRAIAEYADEPTPASTLLDLYVLSAHADETLGELSDTAAAEHFAFLASSFPADARLLPLGLAWFRLLSKATTESPQLSSELEILRTAMTQCVVSMPSDTVTPAVAEELRRDVITDTAALSQLDRSVAQPPTSPEPTPAIVSSSLDAPRAAQLDSMLLNSFTTASELETLTRLAFGVGIFDITRPDHALSRMATDIVAWASDHGRVLELVEVAQRLRPNDPRWSEFAKSLQVVNYVSADPVESVLVSGALPFVGRSVLRAFLRKVNDSAGPRILVVTGPKGSGKSYSAHLIRYAAGVMRTFDVATAALAGRQSSVSDLVMALAIDAGWSLTSIPSAAQVKGLTPATAVRVQADWILSQATRRERPIILVIDGLNTALELPELRDFVAALVLGVGQTTSNRVRLVLLDADPKLLPPQVMAIVTVEQLTPVSREDLRAFFAALLGDQGNPETVTSLTDSVSKEVNLDQGPDMSQLNATLSVIVRETLGNDRGAA